jgi:hypothetical protein
LNIDETGESAMKEQKYALIRFLVILGVISLACGISINMGETPAVAPPPTQLQQQPVAPLPAIPPQPTIAVPPTPNVPQPTVGSEPSNSEVPADFQQLVERYYNKGYLSSTKGEYHPLDDFSKDWAQINNYDLYETGYYPENFMVTAHFEWQSAIRYPDPSGCGFGFHRQGDDHYLFFVDRETVWLGTWDDSSSRFTRIGPTSGDNWVGLGNPGKGDMALIVNQKKAYVVVNNDFKGSYTLDTDWLIGSGELDYTVVSGTNKDYGTRCTMTKVHLWIFEP